MRAGFKRINIEMPISQYLKKYTEYIDSLKYEGPVYIIHDKETVIHDFICHEDNITEIFDEILKWDCKYMKFNVFNTIENRMEYIKFLQGQGFLPFRSDKIQGT